MVAYVRIPNTSLLQGKPSSCTSRFNILTCFLCHSPHIVFLHRFFSSFVPNGSRCVANSSAGCAVSSAATTIIKAPQTAVGRCNCCCCCR